MTTPAAQACLAKNGRDLRPVAALFVRRDSIYKGMPGVDAWDEERDATKWTGGCPVVAHPPCRLWGRLRQFSKAPAGEMMLAPRAVSWVQEFGGVLEHPAESTLWAAVNLPRPNANDRDNFGGFCLCVPQWWFGHRAEKMTWLYIVGCEPAELPEVPFKLGAAAHCVRPTKKYPRLPSITKPEREHTPPAFAEWLVETARRCHAPTP